MARSVEDIRRDSERNRAQLAHTVETLRGKISDTADDIKLKVSPEYIKEEVSGYFAHKGRHWVDTLKQQAMDHPMHAVAIGTAIVLPALKIARGIPLPLLMIGAGLALTSKRVRNAVSDAIPSGDISAQADSVTQGVKDGIKSLKDEIEQTTGAARDAITQTAEDARQSVASMANQASDSVAALRDDVTDRVQSGVNTIVSTTKDAAQVARETVTAFASNSRASAESVVRDHAVLVGGLGLAIGAIIAAALPATRAESKLLGQASDQAKRAASDAVETGFDKAKDAVTFAVGDVVHKFADADIASDVSRMADAMSEKLKTVADKAVMTAFETPHNEQR